MRRISSSLHLSHSSLTVPGITGTPSFLRILQSGKPLSSAACAFHFLECSPAIEMSRISIKSALGARLRRNEASGQCKKFDLPAFPATVGGMKLGSGYYSLSRIGQRLVRADKRLQALRKLFREADDAVQFRNYDRMMTRLKRQEEVLRLRDAGAPFREIAVKLKVTRQRAIQIYQEAHRQRQPLGLLTNGSSHPKKSGRSSRHNPD